MTFGLVLVVALSSCSERGEHQSTEGSPPATSQWSEPAWMTESRQENEELRSKVTSCMADLGWVEKRERDGSSSISFASEADAPRYSKDRTSCESSAREELDITPPTRDEAFFRTMYSMTLDTRECLVSQGVKVSEPPSEDAWIEAVKTGSPDAWAPFNDVTGTEDEFYELFDVCEQAGVVVTR